MVTSNHTDCPEPLSVITVNGSFSGHILTPDIGLTYNSFTTGYGLAGYGVNIKGLSSISRTGKDLYHDGESRGVSYTDTDNLLLDGKRLVLVSGNHGQDGAVYSPENDPFTVITLNGSGQSVWFDPASPYPVVKLL